MRFSRKFKIRITVILGIICWFLLVISTFLVIFSNQNELNPSLLTHLPLLFYGLFFINIYYFFKHRIRKDQNISLTDQLWRVFVTGLIATLISLSLRFFMYLLSGSRLVQNQYFLNLIYDINLGVISIFLLSSLIVWRKLIFYQKSKRLVYSWRTFEIMLLIGLLSQFFEITPFSNFFLILLGILILTAIYLSANLKWVAYLNFKQKWKSILLMILVVLYLWYFFLDLRMIEYRESLVVDLISYLTVIAVIAFVLIYSVSSILVILFNLPTSSVFEKKLEEIINFQRLSQSRNTGKDVDEVYNILFESSISAVLADAAWLEVNSRESEDYKRLTYQIDAAEMQDIRNHITKGTVKKLLSSDPVKNLKSDRYIAQLKGHRFRSILVFPVFVQKGSIGNLCLLKELTDGFNNEMIQVIRTYVNQASISIENFKLLESAIENERYKEELNIARVVQNSLLPDHLDQNEIYKVAAFSQSADEVGGDYYDVYEKSNGDVVFVVGDVSGKGTSAAFQMAQLKGIFSSLVQLDLQPDQFLINANRALGRSLDRSSFITLAYYYIDSKKNQICYARAGHCPALYYHSQENCCKYYYGKGLGLGILRNKEFDSYVKLESISYQKEDILVLITDGITEARNDHKEDFGYDRLKNLIEVHANKKPDEIIQEVLNDLYLFCENQTSDDDFTILVVKFK